VTGLIYVVIIALWAAVLIPIWLRRHDQISEVRSTARFSSAMKSLGSQGQVQYATDSYPLDGQAMGMALPPMRSPDREARMPRPTTAPRTRPAEGLDPDYERELVRQAAATRRALVLGALTLILLVTLVLAIVSVLPQWAPILAAVPVVAFVLASSMTASARSGARSSARPARRAPRATEADPARTAAPTAPTAQAEDDWETWNAWDDEDSWEAVPQTLPTYVSAPRASAVPRGIDRAHPGEWTGEAMVETARAMRSRPRSAQLADPADIDHGATTAEIPLVGDDYAERRAVNE
jgi:hypothetical protein